MRPLSHTTRWRHRLIEWTKVTLVAVVPVALSLLLLWFWLDASLFDYLPVQSDEASYWHQSTSFARVGFAHGYYTYQEAAPSIGAAGPWGPVFPALVGTIMRITGLTGRMVALPIIMIAGFIGLTAAGLTQAELTRRQLLLATGLFMTFGPLIIYLVSGMQEPLHLGVGVLLAALFSRQIDERNTRLAMVTVLVIVGASLLRPIWAPLLLPALLLCWRNSIRQIALVIAVSVSTAAVLGAAFSVWSAQVPFGNSYAIVHAPLGDLAGLLQANFERNVSPLLQVRGVLYKESIWQRYALLLSAAGLTLVAVSSRLAARDRLTALIGWLAIVPSFGLLMLIYDIGNGTRVLMAHFFLFVVLALFRGGRWAVVPLLVIGINIATWSWFQHGFEQRTTINYGADEASIGRMRRVLAPYLQYDPSAERWCNTVLLSSEYGFFYEMSAIDPGIGVSIDLSHEFEGNRLRSKYVIATDLMFPYLPSDSLVKIAETPPRGALYRNLATHCPDS